MTLHYFAYGSNMHPARLSQRVPSSTPIGPAELPGYQLHFHKIGRDGSGKCNVVRSGHRHHRVAGVVYKLPAVEKSLLDAAEGLGQGYELAIRTVALLDSDQEVFFYVAQRGFVDDTLKPYHWYKDLVVRGAQAHGLPPSYIAELRGVVAMRDPDARRVEQHRRILEAGD